MGRDSYVGVGGLARDGQAVAGRWGFHFVIQPSRDALRCNPYLWHALIRDPDPRM